MAKINIMGYRIGVPGHPVPRIALGGAMLCGGLLGFLPVVGYWMVPVGLGILAVDFPPVRRLHRRLTVKIGNVLHRRWPSAASRVGYGKPREARKL